MKAKIIFGILMLLMASLGQGQFVVKENTAVSLPATLIDDTDFKTQETGVAGASVTVKHKHAADSSWTTKDVSGSGWDEIGDGVYEIDFNTSDIGSESATNQGIFLYMVEGSGYLTYYGSAQMIPQSLKDNADDTNAILADTEAQDTASELRTLLAGGNWAISTQTNLTAGIVVLTSATETQINNIEEDTNETQGNQSNFITATGFATESELNTHCISETEMNGSHGSCQYCTASGFSTHSVTNVWNESQAGYSSADTFGYYLNAEVGNLPTVTAIWNESQTSYNTINTFGYHLDAKITDTATATNIWNETQSSYTTTGTFGYLLDSQVSGAQGMTSGQNSTLYSIFSATGNRGDWNQGMIDMLGYNVSDGNVETDLDSTGGTTPAAVWTYNILTGVSAKDILEALYEIIVLTGGLW